MRTWSVSVVWLACLACSQPAPPPVTTTAATDTPWTVERALATLPADTMVALVLDLPRLRESSAVKPHWDAITARVQRIGSLPYSEICPALAATTNATIVASMSVDNEWTLFLLGASAREHRDCWLTHASQHPDALAIEATDKLMTAEVKAPRARRTTSLLVDDQTVLIRVQEARVTERDLRARLVPAANPIRSPELAWLLANKLPFMAHVHGAPAKLAAVMKGEPVDTAVGFATSPRVVAHARSRFATPQIARTIADSAAAYLTSLKSSGYVDAASADATGEQLSLEVTWEDATIVKLAEKIGPLLP